MRIGDRKSVVRRVLLGGTLTGVLACGGGQDAAPTAESAPPAETSSEAAPAKPAASPQSTTPSQGADQVTSLHQLRARTIEGKDQALGDYEGKVALVVNTASECGFTPQYAGLEELWKKYKDKGLVVLGFPSNDFGGQEPGTDKEVQSFCQVRYGVSFPLFSKSVVKGQDASAVFRFLSSGHGEPKWNFHKYLVDKKGAVVKAFPSDVAPSDPALVGAIEKALATP
jgi:glutathione peroxidase